MRKHIFLTLAVLFAVCGTLSAQQSDEKEPAKIELGIQFSSVTVGGQVVPLSATIPLKRSEAGVGGRFGYNLTKSFAFEAEVNFFPNPSPVALDSGGHLLQAQFGTKVGKRFDKFGLFAKARPGFLSFSEVLTQTGTTTFVFNGQTFTFPILEPRRRNFFSLDVGAVVEFYPSRRVLVRFDAGDTMVLIGESPDFGPTQPRPSSHVAHKFQFSSGIAFRFLNPEPKDNVDSHTSRSERKFEAGAQFSSLGFSIFNDFPAINGTIERVHFGTLTRAGFGGRLTYNITPSFAVEAQTDFYPQTCPPSQTAPPAAKRCNSRREQKSDDDLKNLACSARLVRA